MSNLPAHVAAVSNEPQGRQPLWEQMVSFDGEAFSVADIFEQTYVHRRTIRTYIDCLVAGGYAERIDGDPIKFRLICDPVPYHAPRLNPMGGPVKTGTGVENMWRSMRMMSHFTSREIAAHSTTDIVDVTEQTAKSYCSALLRAGYLRVVRKAVPKKSQAIYRLIRNSGPNPPKIQRTKQVFDPNTKTAYPVGSAS